MQYELKFSDMKQIVEKLKKLVRKVREFVETHRRYTFDKEQLLFKKESVVSTLTTFFLLFIVFLIAVILIQNEETQRHKNIAMKHFETIRKLEDKLNDKEYEESRISLYYEIGVAVLEKDCGECNKENICEYIDYLAEMGVVWYPEVLKSTCQIESGFGTSPVARNYKNLFGMDHPTRRKTLSIKCSGGRFATFTNWKCSVLDRVLWDFATFDKHIPSKEEYYGKMNTKYNTENPDYKNIITNCATKFN